LNAIVHFFNAGGWVMYPLLLLSILSINVIIERLLSYRVLANEAKGLLARCIRLCKQGKFDEAQKLCEEQKGPVAACLGVVLRHRQEPVEDVERNVQEVGEEYFIQLEKSLPILDTTTTIAPLLGLLGTLSGMIGTFQKISASARTGANDSILAGVGEALYATATGLSIAVLCFIAYNYFAARARKVTAETEQSATKLINVIRSYEARIPADLRAPKVEA
jgi:biopolymer transport protein ExbB